jgi:hypothetical protein
VIRVINTRILVHWPLTSHQGLNSAMHKDVHQSRTSETLLLQRLERHQKRFHLNLQTQLSLTVLVLRGHWLPISTARGVASQALDIEPFALRTHGGGEQDLEITHLPIRTELEVHRTNIQLVTIDRVTIPLKKYCHNF